MEKVEASPSRGSNTAERILQVAQDIIQLRGYGAMSLEDVAQGVGIRKPSIMHHFRSKAQLATSVVKRYRAYFTTTLDACLKDPTKTAAEALELYFSAYLGLGESEDSKLCLCGALAIEFGTLPMDLQDELRLFFDHHLRWLEAILSRGAKTKEFTLALEPKVLARVFLDSLQGCLLIGRTTSHRAHVRETVQALRDTVGLTAPVRSRSNKKR